MPAEYYDGEKRMRMSGLKIKIRIRLLLGKKIRY
jgi:hypothetical protein